MFDKIKGAFETYSASSIRHKDATLRTIEVKMDPHFAAERIIDLLKKLKYKTIRYNDVYNEIFTSKAGYEITIHCLAGTNGGSSIDVAVFGPEHRGKTRKALRYLLNAIKEKLNTNNGF